MKFPSVPAKLNPLDLTPGLRKGPASTKLSDHDLRGIIAQFKPEASQHDLLDKQARMLVGQTFFGTLLKQMRESPFRSELFEGGRGGQAFAPLYDQKLVEHMSR